MGLTKSSSGIKAVDSGIDITRSDSEFVVALAGNPNVGKSTVFNALTGMNQHTGNWPGKTVATAVGKVESQKHTYSLVDIPGTYSLLAHSAEEEVARDFLCFENPDAVVIVCDATCLERNFNLVLQTLEITTRAVVCVNLMDEAERKNIKIDFEALENSLGVKVVGITAHNKKELAALTDALDSVMCEKTMPIKLKYPEPIEDAVDKISPIIKQQNSEANERWLSLKLLENDKVLSKKIFEFLKVDFISRREIENAVFEVTENLKLSGITAENLKDIIAETSISTAEKICKTAVSRTEQPCRSIDFKIDKFLTGKFTAFPVMLGLLGLTFWLTITFSNYPSKFLSDLFFKAEAILDTFLSSINTPRILIDALVHGMFRVTAWVTAVMLPPMAIFFPLFTLLEDLGYLPRVAYNLDKPFKKCNACGKQSLTMCMGFGCNAAGVTGCRIIDSERERLLAILTNSFVPCNGRFPMIISIITMFLVGGSMADSVVSALILTVVIVFSVLCTFLATKLLSKTLLKGVPSSFTLELPPYRKPQVSKIIVRSLLDRTLFVLGRAVGVAAPAGLLIWLCANITVGSVSILDWVSNFLNPFGKLLGLDGVILTAFILGFPANEIVVPIIIMAYLSTGTLAELSTVAEMKNLFIQNGWDISTAVCMIIFSLMHWPCSTTVLTVKKETGSLKWTALSIVLPFVCGSVICMIVNFIFSLFGI